MAVVHLVLSLDPTSPVPPTDLVPLTLAGYSLPLCTNVMATGLITLVDDSIHTRWQVQPPRHEPVRSYTGDGGVANRHKGLLSNIFQRRRSEQYTNRGKPLATY